MRRAVPGGSEEGGMDEKRQSISGHTKVMLSISDGAKAEQYSLTVLKTFFGSGSKRRSINLLLKNICPLHRLKNGNKESISVLLNIVSQYVAQDSLKTTIVLYLPSACWHHRCIPPYLAKDMRTLSFEW